MRGDKMITKEKTYSAYQKKGLTDAEAERSRKEWGSNEFSKRKRKSFMSIFLSNLADPVTRILLVALVVDAIFVFWGGDIIETVGIGVSVFLAALISTLSERGGEAAFEKLGEELGTARARVIRGGSVKKIPVEQVVVGDTVLLEAGEGIPADGFVVRGRIGVDQSAMTGENREVEKFPSNKRDKSPSAENTALRGCSVLSGECEMEVYAVGDATFLGDISGQVQSDTRESPLKLRLTKLAKQISILGYIAAAFVGGAYLFNNLVIDSGFNTALIIMKLSNAPYLLQNLLRAFMLALTVIVVAVPEGSVPSD